MAAAIIIVNYNNDRDIIDCIEAITCLTGNGNLGVFVAENGGPAAFDALIKALTAPGGSCVAVVAPRFAHLARPGGCHLRGVELMTIRGRYPVVVGEVAENLGYGGGTNSWLKRLSPYPEWDGFWILNPDTTPEPAALSALKAACAGQHCGMAGSTIVDYQRRDHVWTRGLRWRPWHGNAVHVDYGKHISEPAAPGGAAAIDAPSGTSIYVTRACLDKIGYPRDDYFLYYEDIDWGIRAKAAGLLTRADASIVPHKYGTTMGSAVSRRDRSRLSVYLESRNSLLFVWRGDRRVIVWPTLRTLLRAGEYLLAGSARNAKATVEGVMAFFRGETGRPNFIS